MSGVQEPATVNLPSKWVRQQRGSRVPHRIRGRLNQILFYGLVLLYVFVILAPFCWMVISSISPQVELTTKPPHWFPRSPTLRRFGALILGLETGQSLPVASGRFMSALTSSLVVSVTTTLLCIWTGSAAAYALVRLPIPGKGYFLIGMLGAQMLPVIVVVIPLYLLMQAAGLMDSWRGLILLYSGFRLPTVIWIMHSYFQTLPENLEEAAMIDGCSRVGALLRVVVPLSGPGIVAVAAFTFLSAWNEFFMALIFTGSHSKTITVLVTEFSTQFGIDYGLLATGGVVGSIPPLILAFVLQRYIVRGLTSGAMKG
jgi:multiple sugar transport system permease protein